MIKELFKSFVCFYRGHKYGETCIRKIHVCPPNKRGRPEMFYQTSKTCSYCDFNFVFGYYKKKDLNKFLGGK